MSAPSGRVEAGGGIVVDGTGRVAVVRRPGRDWSLPKGKVEAGESHLDAAVREVREETGFGVDVLAEGPTSRYLDHRGRPKRVRYFVMAWRSGRFVPNAEVDRVEWWQPAEAADRLTYPSDRQVVRVWMARTRAQEAAGAGRGG